MNQQTAQCKGRPHWVAVERRLSWLGLRRSELKPISSRLNPFEEKQWQAFLQSGFQCREYVGIRRDCKGRRHLSWQHQSGLETVSQLRLNPWQAFLSQNKCRWWIQFELGMWGCFPSLLIGFLDRITCPDLQLKLHVFRNVCFNTLVEIGKQLRDQIHKMGKSVLCTYDEFVLHNNYPTLLWCEQTIILSVPVTFAPETWSASQITSKWVGESTRLD